MNWRANVDVKHEGGLWPHTREYPWVYKWELKHQELNWVMESANHSLTEVKSTNGKTLAKAKVSRGISLRACVARAAGWTLEKANALPSQEASMNKTSWLYGKREPIEIEVTFHFYYEFGMTHVIPKTITRTRMLKGGGFGLTTSSLICAIRLSFANRLPLYHAN